MKIECPGCGAVGEAEESTLRKGSFSWSCPGCQKLWDIRSAFFGLSLSRYKELGVTTKRLRAEQGITQTQLGELVGVSAAYISQIEAGKRTPGSELSRRILEALGADDEAALV